MLNAQTLRSEFSTKYRRFGIHSIWLDRLNRLPLLREFIDRNPNAPRFPRRELMWDYIAQKARGPIDYLEFGVHEGYSLFHWMRNNEDPKSRFFGFDSFEGLPERWNKNYPKGFFDVAGREPTSSDARVEFIKGWFQDTLPRFLSSYSSPEQTRRVVHIDCDLYSSTLYCLTKLDEVLVPGTIVIFDEFGDVQHEFRALNDYMESYRRKAAALCAREDFYTAAITIL
jgi:O-methyltransferase